MGAIIIFLTIILMTFLTEDTLARAFKRLLQLCSRPAVQPEVERGEQLPPWIADDHTAPEVHTTLSEAQSDHKEVEKGAVFLPWTIIHPRQKVYTHPSKVLQIHQELKRGN
jgi:hypothetical protein